MQETFETLNVDVNNGFGNLIGKLNELPEVKRTEIEEDIKTAFENAPGPD